MRVAPAPPSMSCVAVKAASCWPLPSSTIAPLALIAPSATVALTSASRMGLKSWRSSSVAGAWAVSSASADCTSMIGPWPSPRGRAPQRPAIVDTSPGREGSVSVPSANSPSTLHEPSPMRALAEARCMAMASERSSPMTMLRRGAAASTASVMLLVSPLKRPVTFAAPSCAGCAAGPAMRPFSARLRIEKPPERLRPASAAISASPAVQSEKAPFAKESPPTSRPLMRIGTQPFGETRQPCAHVTARSSAATMSRTSPSPIGPVMFAGPRKSMRPVPSVAIAMATASSLVAMLALSARQSVSVSVPSASNGAPGAQSTESSKSAVRGAPPPERLSATAPCSAAPGHCMTSAGESPRSGSRRNTAPVAARASAGADIRMRVALLSISRASGMVISKR